MVTPVFDDSMHPARIFLKTDTNVLLTLTDPPSAAKKDVMIEVGGLA